jgi:beta-galactosidase
MPIWYGGDYNPEQWPREVWDEDVQLMQRGGINLATVGVFSWAKLEPQEGEFDFEWLDTVLDKLHAGGIRVDLATATASPPPWLTHHYPEVLPQTAEGTRLHPGSRQQYCPSSPVYRRLAARLVTALAERYGEHSALEMWHINNEYGCHVSHCYCDVSAEAFRRWLMDKYASIERLNAAWGTAFWSQGYGSFAEIYPPRAAPTFKNPTQLLDFDRFSSDELLDCYRSELAILREVTPDIPATTNFMGFFKAADYWAWAEEVDVVSDDSYPDPADPASPAYGAMTRDLMRSLRGGAPWILMEQAPSAVNWRRQNAPKAPGQQRAWSYQSVARGADGILFFQWRQSVAGAEKFHSGLVPHAGTDTRIWREVEQLGRELRALDVVQGTSTPARVAMVFDWDSWWSIEQEAVPARLSYVQGVFAWYRELYERGVVVDFVRPEGELRGYDLVVVPCLFVATAAAASNLDDYVSAGGQLLVTYQSAITDENAHISAGGYLGGLQTTLGIRIEEFAPLATAGLFEEGAVGVGLAADATIGISGQVFGDADGLLWSEYLHLDGAEARAVFTSGALAGWPALTRNESGSGAAWYVATQPAGEACGALVEHLLGQAGIVTDGAVVAPGAEVVTRGELTFVINHTTEEITISAQGTDLLTGSRADGLSLGAQGVAILAAPGKD